MTIDLGLQPTRATDHQFSRRTALQTAGSLALAGLLARQTGLTALAQEATPTVDAYPVVEITARNYEFTMPASIAGGWTNLVFHNEGPADHHAMFMKLNDGVTIDDFKDVAMGPDFGALFGVSTNVGGAPSLSPRQTASTILDLAPGNYAIICAIPDENNVPHYQMGMLVPLEVTEATGDLTAPATDAKVELQEFMFHDLPSTVTAGSHIWEVADTGEQVHEFVLYQIVAPGMTFEDVQGIFSAPPSTPEASTGMDMESTPAAGGSPEAESAPFIAIGGTGPMGPGQTNYAVLDLEAGEYFAICFVPDTATGAPHFALGMIMGVTVS
jgi:hypothetical protein